jgi:RF-1 domain
MSLPPKNSFVVFVSFVDSLNMNRAQWTALNDTQLLAQCEVDTYRASGPGGQKRNKTSSAVRIRHLPSGLIVIAEESRSQHENRARALKRLKQSFFLKLRELVDVSTISHGDEIKSVRSLSGKIDLGRKDPRYWPVVGIVLDVLETCEARVSDAAKAIGVSTGNLIDFLETEPKVWEHANQMRQRFGHKPLKTGD